MISESEAYREIIKTIARVFSGISLSLASFISIVFTIALGIPGDSVTVGGYEVTLSFKLVVLSILMSFSFLLFACIMLSLLTLVDSGNGSNNN